MSIADEDKRKYNRNRRKNYIVVGLSLVILCLVLCILGLASLRYSLPPTKGNYIDAPVEWKQNDTKSFRVSTYNICRGRGLDGRWDVYRAVAVLSGNDIIGLNEVGGPSILGAPDQAQQLGKALAMGWLFAPNQTRWLTNYFGNALLSRFNVKGWYSEPLVWSERFESGELSSRSNRNLVTVHYQIGGYDLAVLITHLDRGAIQEEQLRFVLNKFSQYQYAILMGDLNTNRRNSHLAELFKDSKNLDAIKTVLKESDDEGRIDWIIVRGLNVTGGGMHPAGVSDHPNYWIDLEFND